MLGVEPVKIDTEMLTLTQPTPLVQMGSFMPEADDALMAEEE
jgi:hypothetical protein